MAIGQLRFVIVILAAMGFASCNLSDDSLRGSIFGSSDGDSSSLVLVSIDRASGQASSTSAPPIIFEITFSQPVKPEVVDSLINFAGVTVTSYTVTQVTTSKYQVSANAISGTGRLDINLVSGTSDGMSMTPQSGADSTYVDVSSPATGITALTNISVIDGSFDNTCYVANSEVYCAGVTSLPLFHYHLTPFYPKKIDEWSGAQHVCTGDYSTCVWKADGTVSCGGTDSTVMGGTLPSDNLPATTALSDVVDYDCGQHHSCGIVSDGVGTEGELYCWGSNDAAQAGTGSAGGTVATATKVSGLQDLKATTAGHGHNCVIQSDDTVLCWGYNNAGQTGQTAGSPVTTPSAVSGLSNIVELKAGRYNTCGLNSSNQLYCWGQNNRGQLGNGSTTSTHVPQLFLSNVKEFSIGYEFICAIDTSDTLYCAGQNQYGRLSPIVGSSVGDNHTTPTALSLPVTPKKVFATREGLCVTHGSDDQARCWGESRFGQFGAGHDVIETSPVETVYPNNIDDVSTGYNYTCSISNMAVACHGDTWYYKLGNGVYASLDYNYHTPANITNAVANPVEVDAGRYHTCARNSSNEIYCWGYGILLGNGASSGFSNTPVQVTGVSDASQVSLAAISSCYIQSSGGQVACWGLGDYGQLGQAADYGDYNTPQAVALGGSATKLSSKHNNHCALVGGTVMCWGDNTYKQLGDSTLVGTDSGTPRSVALMGAATDVAVGYHHACALVSGSVYCWGEATFGQLGTAQSTGTHYATQVAGLSSITSVYAGYRHNCALNGSNELYCWGDNHAGQVGNGNYDEVVSTPVKVTMPAGTVTNVSLGRSHSCALVGGKQYCWGDHSEGQLGIGQSTYLNTSSSGATPTYNADDDEFPR